MPNPNLAVPPKVESVPEEQVTSAVGQDSEASSTLRRRRGRPRKHPSKVEASIYKQLVLKNLVNLVKRKRGRPIKAPPVPKVSECGSTENCRIPSPYKLMTRQRTRVPTASSAEVSRQVPQSSRTRQPRAEKEVVSQDNATARRRTRRREAEENTSTATEKEALECNSRYGFRRRGGKHSRVQSEFRTCVGLEGKT